MSSQDQYLTVYQFNKNMESHFNQNPNFKQIHIKGEVSGAFTSSYGHFYFDLKDKRSIVPCVIYKGYRKNIGFKIKNGMKLLLIADVDVYIPKGKYQLVVRKVTEDGLGQLYVKYQQLKKKLIKEGLFKAEHKKNLPSFPKSVGVITSKEGSVIHDILKTINQNWPYCEVILFPSQVQGLSATKQLINQLKLADSYDLDVLIIARGGGSIEDLWCFNDESLVRTIFDIKTPIISAIGHESDVTLCDLVSDKRASTPTMAASLAVNDKDKIISQVYNYNARLLTFMSSKINDYKKEFNYMLSKQLFSNSSYIYKSKSDDFSSLNDRFKYSSSGLITSKKNMLNNIKSEYVIRHPCKMQFDSSKLKLNELESRLIDAMDLILKTNRVNLDKTANDFKFLSDKYVQSQKFNLNKIKSSYVIQNPCKIQLNKLNFDLNSSKENIINSANNTIQLNMKNLEKLSSRFDYSSVKLTSSKRVMLDRIKSEYVIRYPCKMQFDSSKLKLNELESRLIDAMDLILKTNKVNLDNTIDGFKFVSDKYISRQSFRLNKSKSKENIIKLTRKNLQSKSKDYKNIRNNNLFKNPEILFQQKRNDLDKIKDEKIIKNPYMILDKYEHRLNHVKERLDKQNEILQLKQEKEHEKSKYQKIIIVIVVIIIIIILLIIGGF